MCEQDQNPETGAAYRFGNDFPWYVGVFDAHCHCGERPLCLTNLPSSRTRGMAVMATRTQDQSLVADMAASYGISERDDLAKADSRTVVAGFGRHPWFSHELYDDALEGPTYVASENDEEAEVAKMKHYAAVLSPSPEDPAFVADLPTPLALSTFIAETRERLKKYPLAMIGEIGLDKAFRLPMHWQPEAKAIRDPDRTPGGRERRPLSPYRISMAHQQAIFKAHLSLAGEMGRSVSVHGVQVHGILYDILVNSWKGYERKGKGRRQKNSKNLDEQTEKTDTDENEVKGGPYPPRICLHSFSGKAEAVRQYLNPRFPSKIFFSFAKTNNLRDESGRSKMQEAVRMVPENRILVETDLHTVGDRMDAELEEVCRAVCEFKGWGLEEGVRKMAANYREFVCG
ncbi:Fc.00g105120.m01.CDS01 [Cosmosporella sp. VM-42]